MTATEQQVDTVVVGGGQAGLALGYYLAQQHRNFVILDAHARVGDAWRTRWDSLRLFTPAKFDGLPGVRFPADPLAFPTKDQHADYLEAYAARLGLPVHGGVTVEAVWRENGRFVVAAGTDQWIADSVVLATGGSQVPKLPGAAESIAPEVRQLHSSDYRNPAQLKPGNVLVVGVGNSGAEIALDVSRSHPTWLAGTPSGELPVRHGRTAARFVLPVIRFAALHVLTRATPLGRKAAPVMVSRAAPLIRTKMRDLAAAGVHFVPRVIGVRAGMPVVDGAVDGDSALSVANIIWCTGYRTDFGWVNLPGFQEGQQPAQSRGIVASVPGLYFLGQEFLFSAVSATVTGVCRDAKYLAAHLDTPIRQPEPATR
jgi:putative flavoprotein involved in K+ transport